MKAHFPLKTVLILYFGKFYIFCIRSKCQMYVLIQCNRKPWRSFQKGRTFYVTNTVTYRPCWSSIASNHVVKSTSVVYKQNLCYKIGTGSHCQMSLFIILAYSLVPCNIIIFLLVYFYIARTRPLRIVRIKFMTFRSLTATLSIHWDFICFYKNSKQKRNNL